MIPAVLIAGTHSGVGKTTITLGLMAALRARGMVVQPFKVGPDFIDPSHHRAVCGRPSHNLDPFMMGLDGVRRSFCSAMKGADAAVVEGVMGLYDGMGSSETGSTAQVAKALGIPVLLVINVHGMSRSAAALELGFTSYDPGVNIAGTILNRVGSKRHLAMLKGTLRLPIYGALPQNLELEMKSRHLGLVMGHELSHDLRALSSLLEEHASVDEILSLGCRPCAGQAQSRAEKKSVRIGVAMDEAFCFYYQDSFRELEAAGAELVFFSPLRDELPDVDGLYIGGGYPELHAAGLEAGKARGQIKRASLDGMPIFGECGGLMYLGEGIESGAVRNQMVGALPGDTMMTGKLQALGYVEAEAVASNPVARIGQVVRGHEFHYSSFHCHEDARFAFRLHKGAGIRNGRDGLVEHETLGGYLHVHFYSLAARQFVESCQKYKRR